MSTIHVSILIGIYGVISVLPLMIMVFIYKSFLCINKFLKRDVDGEKYIDTQNYIPNEKSTENSCRDAHKFYSNDKCGINGENLSHEAKNELELIKKMAKECRMTLMTADRGISLYGWTDNSRKLFVDMLVKNYENKITTMEVNSDDARIDADILRLMKEKYFRKRIVYFGKSDIFSDLDDMPINNNEEENNTKVTIYTYHGLETYRFIY